jgi:triphosphatase
MTGDTLEVEWQFDAPDLEAVALWLHAQRSEASRGILPKESRSQVDTYLDSDDWAVHRAGFTLRMRRQGYNAELTLKSFSTATSADGPRERREINQALPDPNADMLRASGPVSDRLRLLLGQRMLRPLFEVRTLRRPFLVIEGDDALAEITLDDTQFFACPGGHQLRAEPMHRVELEQVANGGLARAASLMDEMRRGCRLIAARDSKFGTGLRLAGFTPEHALNFGDVSFEPEGSATDFALASARRQFAEFLWYEPGTRLGEDPEALHQMRVASRRLVTGLGDFASALPASFATLRAELDAIVEPLGRLRDLDVQRDMLVQQREAATEGTATAFAPVIDAMDEERAAARADLLRHLDTPRYRAFVSAMAAALRVPELMTGVPEHAHELAERVVRSRYRTFQRRGVRLKPGSEATAYHAVRRRARRLRYALDTTAPLFGRRGTRMLNAVRDVQDVLGAHQDADVAAVWLRGLSRKRGEALPPATHMLIGELSGAHEESMRLLRKRWPRVFIRVRKRWRALRDSFDARDQAEAGVQRKPPFPRER